MKSIWFEQVLVFSRNNNNSKKKRQEKKEKEYSLIQANQLKSALFVWLFLRVLERNWTGGVKGWQKWKSLTVVPAGNNTQRFSWVNHLAKYLAKHLYQNLFFNKVAGLRPATLLKKRFWYRCFPVNFAKFLRTPYYRTPPDDCFCT